MKVVLQMVYHMVYFKYGVKQKSAKLFMMYAVGKLEAALNSQTKIIIDFQCAFNNSENLLNGKSQRNKCHHFEL